MRTGILMLISIILALTSSANAQETVTGQATNTTTDSALQTVTPYFLQHQYLSVLALMVAENDGHIFETPYILNTMSTESNGFRSPFTDADIQVEKITAEGKDIYVWCFPEPEFLREALYMAFVPVDGHYKAFSICIGKMVDWEISTSTTSSRSTFGRVKRPESAKECVDLLIGRGVLAGDITSGEFIQKGYTSPQYR